MKITLYTIKDCAFSKQEKEYLNTNKLVFEEKDLETNKDFLTEMLAISNNFAGTPVTRVEKDDGTIAVLKGFTKEEFDTTFGFAPVVPPVVEAPPVVPTESVSPAPTPAQPTETPTPVVETPDPLKSVMDDLQAKVDESLPPVVPVEQPPAPPVQSPTETIPPVVEQPTVVPPTPSVVDSTAPSIPDFPAK